MLRTTIDRSILEDFYKSLYSKYYTPSSSLEDKKFATMFQEFLKKNTQLHIINWEEGNLLTNEFTHGIGDSPPPTFSFKGFLDPGNFVTSLTKPNNCYFVDIQNETQRERYRSSYGYFFSFLNDYKDQFVKLSLLKKFPNRLLVRRNVQVNYLKSWNDLTDYLLPFTDMVLVDNFLFSDRNLYDTNLTSLLTVLDKAAPVRYNLLFITFEGKDKEVNAQRVKRDLEKIRKEHSLKFEFGVYVANRKLKEHDRGIFMNYLRIQSGDSFNYFDARGEVAIDGTTIEFCPYIYSSDSFHSEQILQDIKLKIKSDRSLAYRFEGIKGNRLLGL